MKINKLLAHSSNFTKGRKKNIQFLVIHYTANNGDTAKGNCNYFKSANRNASAHYFVDEKEVWQSVEDNDTAWHCGTSGKYYHSSCRNENAIGIELCSEKDSKGNYYFNDATINTAVELAKIIMKKYNIPIGNIVRHYDVTRKVCPAPFVNNTKAWENFKSKLKEDVKDGEKYMIIKRNYEYNGKVSAADVINHNGVNYIKVQDLKNIIGKDISYDNVTKITKFIDSLASQNITINGKEVPFRTALMNDSTFVELRKLATELGYDVDYDPGTKKISLKIKENFINMLKKFFHK